MISFEPFRKLLLERKISTYYLRTKCGQYSLDNKTIKRLLEDDSVSTNTINALCNIFDCSLTDIMEFVPDNTDQIDSPY